MMKIWFPKITLFFLIILLGCNKKKVQQKAEYEVVDTTFPYSLNEPKATYNLPISLEEISGLAYLKDGKMACVQDEEGTVFIFDAKKQKIVGEYMFADEGDYEGIAVVDTMMYVINSEGKIYRLRDFKAKKLKVKKYKTALSEKNDIEGLCYDKVNNRLLIACKGDAGINKKIKKAKAIYAFDLDKKELSKEPVFLIHKDDLEEFTGKKEKIGPSGIEIHPITGEIYVLNHVGKLLIVMSPEGVIKKVMPLNPTKYRQPEGLSFSQNGTMYISNEAAYREASIMRFIYQQ